MNCRKRWLLFLCLFALVLSWRRLLTKRSNPPPSYRGCIVTLIRSDHLVSLNKLLNMLNSLYLYFQNIHRYRIYLFHESTLTNQTKEQIIYCASRLNIQFYQIDFNVTNPSNRSGYASMCQFWSYDLWFKYQFLRNECDYLMRFDDDSYLINSTQYDLFEEFHRNQYDYAYRMIYHDNNGLDFLQENFRRFLPSNRTRRGCIQSLCTNLDNYDGLAVYNNFFLVRMNLFYEYPIIEEYLKQLMEINAFHRYRIGDANIQTICLLLIDKPMRITAFKFPYNHNVHGASEIHPSFVYYKDTALMWHFRMRIPNVTCHKLLIVTKYTIVEKNIERL